MPRIKAASIEAIKTRIPLEEVAGRLVQLKRAGRNWRGLSPFSNEKTPSFYVLPDKNIFKCFSTGLAGDVIRFIQETEKLEFVEAIETLAERHGVHIEYEDGGGPSNAFRSLRKEILEIHEYAADFYHRQFLSETDGGPAIQNYWQAQRGFPLEIAKDFKIGYAPPQGNALNELLLKKEFSEEAIQQCGLFYDARGRRDISQWKARFRGRLMIPIRNIQGQIIAFTARQLNSTPEDDPAREAKYVNSPETPVFHKGRMLFNLDRASRPGTERNCFYMVEGQLDALRCTSAGFENTIAPQGTGVTQEQLRLLGRYSHQLTIVLDGDRAGKEAALRILPIALRAEIELSFVTLPDGSDPDSYIQQNGTEAWQQLLDQAITAMEFALPALLQRHPDTPIGRREAFQDLFLILRESESAIVRNAYLEDAIVIAREEAHAIRQDFEHFLHTATPVARRAQDTEEPAPVKKQRDSLTTLEGVLLWIVLQDVNWAQRLAQVIDHHWINSESPEGKVLARILAEAEADTWEGTHQIDELLDSQAERDCFFAVYAEERPLENVEAIANECLLKLARRHIQNQIEQLSSQLADRSTDADTLRRIFGERKRLSQLKQDLIKHPQHIELPPIEQKSQN